MARIHVNMPKHFSFSTTISVRIRDINYGGHLDNAALLSIIHEARVRYLGSIGCTELDAGGSSLIMTDAAIEYKGEGFSGDRLTIQIAADEFSTRGFTLFYKVTCLRADKEVLIAHAQTGMLFFNYETRKVVHFPKSLKEKLKPKI